MQKTVLASCGALLFGSVVLAACSGDNSPAPTQQGGSANTAHGGSAPSVGGSPAVGGSNVVAQGGSTGGSAGTGASSEAGSSGSASVGGTAGGTPGGTTGGTGGKGGGSSAGAGSGSAGSAAGGGGGKAPVVASAGCGKASPQTGSSSNPLTVSSHQYYVKLPTGYDASKPYPVMMMFNPTGNPLSWAEQNAGFETTGPKENWIRAYPTMANNSSGWQPSDVSFFQPFYDAVLANYCVDKSRVFAGGESSGGDFVSILGCEYGDKIRATAPGATKPVNGYALDVPIKRQCKGEVTAVVIHGKNDNVVTPANGPKTRDFYAALNHCGTMTTPVQGYTDTLSNCVMYQGCDAGFPVYWCNHTDPNYSGTNHGWPAFANKFLYSLFSGI
jgi:poly(3-hydroxybutyrate) depolymerase